VYVGLQLRSLDQLEALVLTHNSHRSIFGCEADLFLRADGFAESSQTMPDQLGKRACADTTTTTTTSSSSSRSEAHIRNMVHAITKKHKKGTRRERTILELRELLLKVGPGRLRASTDGLRLVLKVVARRARLVQVRAGLLL
jgi:hypothetical protein